MTEYDATSPLPRIQDEDLGIALFEEFIDPTHRARFDHLARTNPKLIREISRRAYVDAYTSSEEGDQKLISTLDLQKIILDNVTFALSVLEHSIKRQLATIDAGDDADQLHSSELGDDQPTE